MVAPAFLVSSAESNPTGTPGALTGRPLCSALVAAAAPAARKGRREQLLHRVSFVVAGRVPVPQQSKQLLGLPSESTQATPGMAPFCTTCLPATKVSVTFLAVPLNTRVLSGSSMTPSQKLFCSLVVVTRL